MTEEIKDFDWNSGDVIEEPASDGKHMFGRLKMHIVPVKRAFFQKGAGLTVEGIYASRFDIERGNEVDGLKKFGGYEKASGSPRKLFILVAEQKDKEGQTYQVVKSYSNQPDKKDDFHYWQKLVFPALQAGIPEHKRGELTSAGVWAEWDEVGTGQYFNDNEIKYWNNFIVHPNEESLRKAEQEFFSQFSNGTEQAPVQSFAHYPKQWESDPAALKAFVQSIKDKGHKDIVKEAMLEGEAINGQPVDVKSLLAELLDIPTPMVQL